MWRRPAAEQAARRAGLEARLDAAVDLPVAVTAAVRLDDQILFHPRRYCLGLVREAAGSCPNQARLRAPASSGAEPSSPARPWAVRAAGGS